MEQKKAVAVLLGDDGTSINLVWGSNNIGRGNLAVSDKKVSRNHGNLFLCDELALLFAVTIVIINPGVGQEPIVTFEVVGVNPCMVGDNLLQKGEKYPLAHGEKIIIATENHAFTFLLNSETNLKPQIKRKREEEKENEAVKNTAPIGEKRRRKEEGQDAKTQDWDASYALAFPSFGTNTFAFDIDRAATGTPSPRRPHFFQH